MKSDFGQFIRECYLRSEPSVDLDEITTDNPIDCCKHTLLCSVYDSLLEEYCENKDEEYACNMWMLQSGPQLKED